MKTSSTCDKASRHATSTGRLRLRCLLVAVLASVVAATTVATEQASDLKTQVGALAERHGFSVVGLHRLADEPAKAVEGDPSDQLRELLRSYNYLALQDDGGHIEQLLISSRKRPVDEVVRGYRITTTRRGGHHVVKAVLVGPGGARQTASLIVDTGASDVVLPYSMSKQLGFEPTQLRASWSQTANGKVQTKRGMIKSLRIGQAKAENVMVNFVEDESLGDVKLLGMSFLGRFQVTIDEENGLVLITK